MPTGYYHQRTLQHTLKTLFGVSADLFQGGRLHRLSHRAKFLALALLNYTSVARILGAKDGSALQDIILSRPETLGAVIWPYQCIGWTPAVRLSRIIEHFQAVEQLKPLRFDVNEAIRILALDEVRSELTVVVDQPKWFMREGQLSINLFQSETRLYTLAFSFGLHAGQLVAYIGAIQGRDIPGALDAYRDLTKCAHGMRPRDLLIEVFRMLCTCIQVTRIFAVSDEFRIHRSSYFGKDASHKIHLNYNEIWQDRGGKRYDRMFYELPTHGQLRELDAIPQKKRAMYRRRYEMLASMEARLNAWTRSADPRPIDLGS
jgi:uncharacterized protein